MKTWEIVGAIVNKEKQPLSGIFITLVDKDLFMDDILGSNISDTNGKFSIKVSSDACRQDFFHERFWHGHNRNSHFRPYKDR